MTERAIFNNQPVAMGHDEQGNGQYLDWSGPITTITNQTRILNEGLLHRDPDQVRRSLFILDQNYAYLKAYLQHEDIGVMAVPGEEDSQPETDIGEVEGDPWPLKEPTFFERIRGHVGNLFNGQEVLRG